METIDFETPCCVSFLIDANPSVTKIGIPPHMHLKSIIQPISDQYVTLIEVTLTLLAKDWMTIFDIQCSPCHVKLKVYLCLIAIALSHFTTTRMFF